MNLINSCTKIEQHKKCNYYLINLQDLCFQKVYNGLGVLLTLWTKMQVFTCVQKIIKKKRSSAEVFKIHLSIQLQLQLHTNIFKQKLVLY